MSSRQGFTAAIAHLQSRLNFASAVLSVAAVMGAEALGQECSPSCSVLLGFSSTVTIFSLLRRKKPIRVTPVELELLRRENAEAGIPTLERNSSDRDQAMPRTWNLPLWMWGQRRSNGAYPRAVGTGNPVTNNEIENLNRRYQESALREAQLRDD
jgi:hypothetical protein